METEIACQDLRPLASLLLDTASSASLLDFTPNYNNFKTTIAKAEVAKLRTCFGRLLVGCPSTNEQDVGTTAFKCVHAYSFRRQSKFVAKDLFWVVVFLGGRGEKKLLRTLRWRCQNIHTLKTTRRNRDEEAVRLDCRH